MPSPAELAWHTALADAAMLGVLRDWIERAWYGRRRVPHPSLTSLHASVAWPTSPAMDAIAATLCATPSPTSYPEVTRFTDEVTRALRPVRAARDVAWQAWCVDDPTVPATVWVRPAIRAIGSRSPLTPALHAALLDAVEAGSCTAAEVWSALRSLREPAELLHATWARVHAAWSDHAPTVPRVWAPFVRAVLAHTPPEGKGARVLFDRWRSGAVRHLARFEADPTASAIIADQVANTDPTAPLTADEIHTLPSVDRLTVPEILALSHRLPIPAWPVTDEKALTNLDTLILHTCDAFLDHPLRADAIWRAVWAQATTPAQHLALYAAGGFRRLGPWLRDPVIMTALCRAFAQPGTIPYRHGSPHLEDMLSLFQGHADAAA